MSAYAQLVAKLESLEERLDKTQSRVETLEGVVAEHREELYSMSDIDYEAPLRPHPRVPPYAKCLIALNPERFSRRAQQRERSALRKKRLEHE